MAEWRGDQLTEFGIDPQALIEQSRTLADGAAARAHSLVRRFVFDVARRPAGSAWNSPRYLLPLTMVCAETVLTPGGGRGGGRQA